MSGTLYNMDILRLAANIPHLKRLERAQATVERRSPTCGSRVLVDVALNDEGQISDLGWEVNACALGQASASLLSTHAIGHSAQEIEIGRAHV